MVDVGRGQGKALRLGHEACWFWRSSVLAFSTSTSVVLGAGHAGTPRRLPPAGSRALFYLRRLAYLPTCLLAGCNSATKTSRTPPPHPPHRPPMHPRGHTLATADPTPRAFPTYTWSLDVKVLRDGSVFFETSTAHLHPISTCIVLVPPAFRSGVLCVPI